MPFDARCAHMNTGTYLEHRSNFGLLHFLIPSTTVHSPTEPEFAKQQQKLIPPPLLLLHKLLKTISHRTSINNSYFVNPIKNILKVLCIQ